MKKIDYITIGSLIGVLLISLILMNLLIKNEGYAIVYHNGENVLEIDLSVENTYTINGDLGEMLLEVKNGKIRMSEVICPNEICKSIGWTNNPSKPIICVPNKIYVCIVGISSLDVIIG